MNRNPKWERGINVTLSPQAHALSKKKLLELEASQGKRLTLRIYFNLLLGLNKDF